MIKEQLFLLFKTLTVSLDGTGLGKIPGVLTVHSKIKRLLLPKYIKIGNDILFLDKEDSLSLGVFGFYNEAQLDFTKLLVKKGWVVVDVGAHIGYFTLFFSRLTGASGKVFSFEPNTTNYKTLKRNIMQNNLTNVIAENKAISDTNGKMFFSISESSVEHKLADGIKNTGKNVTVNSVTLDKYFKNHEKEVDLVKIDVEGAEYMVLRGMENLLKVNKRVSIIIEYCSDHLAEYEITPHKLFDFLSKYNFDIYDIDDLSKKVVKSDAKKIINKYKSGGLTNLFLTRIKIPVKNA